MKITSQKRDVLQQIVNKKTHFNFSQIFRLFSKPSTVCNIYIYTLYVDR